MQTRYSSGYSYRVCIIHVPIEVVGVITSSSFLTLALGATQSLRAVDKRANTDLAELDRSCKYTKFTFTIFLLNLIICTWKQDRCSGKMPVETILYVIYPGTRAIGNCRSPTWVSRTKLGSPRIAVHAFKSETFFFYFCKGYFLFNTWWTKVSYCSVHNCKITGSKLVVHMQIDG